MQESQASESSKILSDGAVAPADAGKELAGQGLSSKERLYDMVLCGRFQVCGVLGGGIATAYKCRDLQNADGPMVVLKKIDKSQASRGDEIERLREAMAAVDALNLPGVVRMFGIFEDDVSDAFYQCMAYVDGLDMQVWLANQQGQVAIRKVREICRQVAESLDAIHKAGYAHGDVRPASIIVQAREGDLKAILVDFSWAAALNRGEPDAAGARHGMRGTPMYRAPELWSGKRCTAASDQYSLAASIYEALTGSAPFADIDLDILKEDVLQRKVPWNNSFDGAVNRALQRALSKKPERRFESCLAFYQAFYGTVPHFGRYIAALSVAIAIVMYLLATDHPGRISPEKAAALHRLAGIVAAGKTVDWSKQAVVEFEQYLASCRRSLASGLLDDAGAAMTSAETCMQRMQVLKKNAESIFTDVSDHLKALRRNVDVSQMFAQELADVEVSVRTLESLCGSHEYTEFLERQPKVEKAMAELEKAYDEKTKAQQSGMAAARAALTSACGALGAEGAPSLGGKSARELAAEAAALLESAKTQNTYATRETWLASSAAFGKRLKDAVSPKTAALLADVSSLRGTAVAEKLPFVDNSSWRALEARMDGVAKLASDDIASYVKINAVKGELEKYMSSSRARKAKLQTSFKESLLRMENAFRELESAHAVLSPELSDMKNLDWNGLWGRGDFQLAAQRSQASAAQAQSLLKQYRSVTSAREQLAAARGKEESRYKTLLPAEWSKWLDGFDQMQKAYAAGRYDEVARRHGELMTGRKALESRRQEILVKKGSDLMVQWESLKDVLARHVPANWMDAAALKTLEGKFDALLKSEKWEDARAFLAVQRNRAAHLDTYAKSWAGYKTAFDAARAKGVVNEAIWREKSQAFGKLLLAENWDGADKLVKDGHARLATMGKCFDTLQAADTRLAALKARHFDTLLPDGWKALCDARQALPAEQDVTEQSQEAFNESAAKLSKDCDAFETAATAEFAARQTSFDASVAAFNKAVAKTVEQARLDAKGAETYKQFLASCQKAWAGGDWAAEKRVKMKRRELRTLGVSSVLVNLLDGVSMTLLPLIPGEYDKTHIIVKLWPWSDIHETRHVQIEDTLWMGETEVSREQYRGLLKQHADLYEKLRATAAWERFVDPLQAEESADEHGARPMTGISWGQAALWCELLTEIERQAGRLPEGYVYRLPTEAEWEYAALLGRGTAEGAPAEALSDVVCDDDGPADVKSGRPNGWNFYHLLGNVCEWCLDVYVKESFNDPALQQMVPGLGTTSRVVKGGSYKTDPNRLDVRKTDSGRAAALVKLQYKGFNQGKIIPRKGTGYDTVGFRVVLAPEVEKR